jgi:transcription-repair coupling factor (superfamily II helicase)
MQNKELEEVMIQFTSGRIQVLVCTNIIESGLDIPNANTIVINEAHMFGLADLYQLRGRVGRFKHRAYAYLLIPRGVLLSSEAQRRVKAIGEFSELGSGFKIAMRDLEIRGAGNLLGPQQHGYIVQVGFDLYCRLLEAATRELNGELPEEPKAILDLGLDGYLPDDYISDPKVRITIYRKFVSITDSHGFSDLAQELCDRFGKIPWPVGFLFRVAKLRMLAGQSGIRYIGKQDDRLVLDGLSGKKVYPLNMGWSSEELLSSVEGILRQEAGWRRK